MTPPSVMKKCLIPSFEIVKKEVQMNFLFCIILNLQETSH